MSVDLTLWSSEAWTSAADDYLLSQARGGSAEAYAELWRRNLSAAYAVAHRFRGRAAAEDVVAEASARVFGLLADGRGPEQNFRSYFLSTVKTVAIDGARRDLKLSPAADEDLEELAPPRVEDFDADLIDGDLVRSAFRGLSERDQRLLWHTTVEGATPRAIAPELGMSPNTVSAQASRARAALRARYLDAHAERGIAGADSAECRWTIERLGAHVQGRLPKRQEARVAAHLGACHHAAGLAARLRVIDESFPVLVAPLAFLAGASMPGFLAGTTMGGLTSAAATGAAVAGPMAGAGHASAGSTAGAALPAGTAGSSAAVGAGATPPPAPPGWVDTVGSITSRAAAVAVGVAIGVGLTAGPDPGPRPTAATVSPPPTPSQPASAVPGVIPVTPPPAAVPAPPTPSPTTPPSPLSPLSAPTVPLAPVAPSARLPQVPPPTADPALEVLKYRYTTLPSGADDATVVTYLDIRVDVQSLGATVVTLSNQSGQGRFDARNLKKSCVELTRASIRCDGWPGWRQFEQTELTAPDPIVVTIRQEDGTLITRVLPLG